MRLVASLILFFFAVTPVFSQERPLHRQLVISLTESWDSSAATLFRFDRDATGPWRCAGKRIPAVVGERGLAWDAAVTGRNADDPVKQEGDRRAPAGMFPLPYAMGFAGASPPGATLPFRTIEVGTHCVDDPASRYYNRIVDERELPAPVAELWNSSERMWQLADLYRLLVVVDYNMSSPQPGNGSCIFIHVRRDTGGPTTGCTALAGEALAELVRWLRPEANPVLVQLPRHAYRKVWREWGLPAPELLEAETVGTHPLMDVRSVVPRVRVQMKYASADNFTGSALYDCGRCFLLPGTAEKLAAAQRELEGKGLSLKLWDCYRPLSVQKLFWERVPDPRYVADPRTGSKHNRGSAVDATLTDASGREVEMPTRFDEFSSRAAHAATDASATARENRRLLADAMQKAGFRPIASEWWHYDDPAADGELLDVSFGELCRQGEP